MEILEEIEAEIRGHNASIQELLERKTILKKSAYKASVDYIRNNGFEVDEQIHRTYGVKKINDDLELVVELNSNGLIASSEIIYKFLSEKDSKGKVFKSNEEFIDYLENYKAPEVLQ